MKLKYCVVYDGKNEAGSSFVHIIYKKSLSEVEKIMMEKDSATVFPMSDISCYCRPCVTVSDGRIVLYRLESKEDINNLKEALGMMKDATRAGMVSILK